MKLFSNPFEMIQRKNSDINSHFSTWHVETVQNTRWQNEWVAEKLRTNSTFSYITVSQSIRKWSLFGKHKKKNSPLTPNMAMAIMLKGSTALLQLRDKVKFYTFWLPVAKICLECNSRSKNNILVWSAFVFLLLKCIIISKMVFWFLNVCIPIWRFLYWENSSLKF